MKKSLFPVVLLCFCIPLFSGEISSQEEKTTVPASYESAPKKYAPASLGVSAEIALPTPQFADVKNLQDKTFDADAKLAVFVPDFSRFSYAQTEAGTADDFFVAPATVPAKRDALVLFRTFVTPRAFTRSKITATTPQKCELWVNGKKLAGKSSTEAEREKSGAATADFDFDDGRAEIVVKILSQKDDKLPPMVKLEIEPKKAGVPAPVFSAGTEKEPVTIASVNEVERVAGLKLSPNGKYVLATYSRLRDDGAHAWRVEVRETATGALVFFEDGNHGYTWMPRGARLYFRRADANDRCALVAFDFETRKETVLVEGLPNADHRYSWTPDESALIVARTEKWKTESPDWARVISPEDREKGWRDRTFLSRYDLKTGIFEPLTAGSQSTWLCGISPDSEWLVFSIESVDYTQPEYSLYDYYLLNLKTLKCEPLFEKQKFRVEVGAWSPDGSKMLLLAGTPALDGLGSTLPAGTPGNSYDDQAFIFDVKTRQIEPITKDFDPSVSTGTWAGDGNIYLTAQDRDRSSIFRYEPAAKRFTRLVFPAENVYAFNVQNDPAGFVPVAYAIGSGPVNFPGVYKIDLKNNTAERVFVDNLATSAEENFSWPEVKSWAFEASDGTEIDGFYLLPNDFDPAKKYPLIVHFYSGTTPTRRALGSHYPLPLYAAHGYVVYVVQPSGAIGYGQEFSARHINAWGRRTAEDIIEGVKKFCADHAFVDAKKVGCISASYGGFMTMYLQTRTDIFAAAVAHAGISDITSYWGEGTWGYAYNSIAAAGSFPWKDKDLFVGQSPLFSADKINTPILLCHGLSDGNVPVGESIQMFTALKLLGKPVELLTFTAEDHGIMNYSRRRRWVKSHLAWFDRWLKDEPDWWETLYPDKNW